MMKGRRRGFRPRRPFAFHFFNGILSGAFLIAASAPSLTPSQKRTLEREFICPERLPDDEARIEAVKRFINRYAIFAPRSSINERMAFRDSLFAKNNCAPPKRELHYDFPQT